MAHESTASLVLAALLAALIAAGAYVHIPLPFVPVVLSDAVVVLAGLLAGPATGATAAGGYVLVGALGLPVFSGGSGGLGHLLGPTGGYLAGFIAGAALAGAGARMGRGRVPGDLAGALAGWAAIFAGGFLWLVTYHRIPWEAALMDGVVRLLPVTAAKIPAVILLARACRPMIPASLRPGRGGGVSP